MLDTVAAVGEVRITPVPQTVELDIFIQEFSNSDELFRYALVPLYCNLGRTELTNGLLIFELCNEEDVITEPEMDPAENLRLEVELLGHKLRKLDAGEFMRHVLVLFDFNKK